MDVVFLSRLQFAAATLFHFLFVPVTLGLAFMVAWMETRYARTGDKLYLSMTKFWGKLFLINFALGVVTGITIVIGYQIWAYRLFSGKLTQEDLAYEDAY